MSNALKGIASALLGIALLSAPSAHADELHLVCHVTVIDGQAYADDCDYYVY